MSMFTMSPGIVCEDGTVLGRISDLDLFGSFELQTDQIMLSPEIDGVASVQPMFDEKQREKMAWKGGKLWKISKKGRGQIEQEKTAERNRQMKHRVEVYAEAQAFGVLLPSGDAEDD